MINTIDTFNDICENLQKTVDIINIIDNGNNTYNVYLSDIYLQYINNVLIISGSGAIDGEHLILEVFENYVTIELTSGLIISTFGKAKNYINYFFDTINGAKDILIDMNKLQEYANKKTPLILFLVNFNEKIDNTFVEPNLKIYLIEKTERTKTNVWRNENTLKYLQKIEIELINKMRRNQAIMSNFTYDHSYLFFGSEGENKLDMIIDAIELNLDELKLVKNFKNC